MYVFQNLLLLAESFFSTNKQVFREKLKEVVNYSWNVGVEIMLPGEGKVVVRFYLAALNGDKPALMQMIAMKKGESKYGCHLCCFNTKRCGRHYDPDVHMFRNFKTQVTIMYYIDLTRYFHTSPRSPFPPRLKYKRFW